MRLSSEICSGFGLRWESLPDADGKSWRSDASWMKGSTRVQGWSERSLPSGAPPPPALGAFSPVQCSKSQHSSVFPRSARGSDSAVQRSPLGVHCCCCFYCCCCVVTFLQRPEQQKQQLDSMPRSLQAVARGPPDPTWVGRGEWNKSHDQKVYEGTRYVVDVMHSDCSLNCWMIDPIQVAEAKLDIVRSLARGLQSSHVHKGWPRGGIKTHLNQSTVDKWKMSIKVEWTLDRLKSIWWLFDNDKLKYTLVYVGVHKMRAIIRYAHWALLERTNNTIVLFSRPNVPQTGMKAPIALQND